MKKLITLVSVCLFLSACGDKVYDKSYYTEHLDEAKQVVEKCKSGEMSGENCHNAQGAVSDAAMRELLHK